MHYVLSSDCDVQAVTDSNSPYSIAHRVPVQSQQIKWIQTKPFPFIAATFSCFKLAPKHRRSDTFFRWDVPPRQWPFDLFTSPLPGCPGSLRSAVTTAIHCAARDCPTCRATVPPSNIFQRQQSGSLWIFHGSFRVDDGWWRLMVFECIWWTVRFG